MMPNVALGLAWAPPCPLAGAAEAIPAFASIIASMSAVATSTASLLLNNTSLSSFPKGRSLGKPRSALYNATTVARVRS